MPDLQEFVTTKDAAQMLDFHVEHVRKMLRDGDLKGAKMGHTWLVYRKSVEQYRKDTAGFNKFDPRRARHQ
jgi:excisionase family DNA binding protein